MRILTVRQPWAWAIIHGGKDVENRVRNIAGNYRGPVAIHAGLARFDDDGQYREVKRAVVSELNGWPADDSELWGADSIEPDDPRFIYGAIVGIVELIDAHHSANCMNPVDPADSSTWKGCTPWAEPVNVYHMVLAKAHPIAEPIPYKGALGLRKLPADVVMQIEALRP